MIEFTAQEISTYYQHRVPNMAQPDKREWRGKCPVHNGTGDNFAVRSDTGQAHCHSQCGKGWDIISLEMELTGSDFAKAKQSVFSIVGRPAPAWEDRDIEAAYDYVDQNGKLSYQVIRKHGKRFAQRRPGPSGEWVWNLKGVAPLLYRLPEVIAASFVAIVEGEKDADNLRKAGITATCNSGGAGKFSRDFAPLFAGKRVAILPDNDQPGREHALAIAEMLSGVAQSVKIVELSGLPPKGDVSDFLAAGGTVEQLRELYRKAPEFSETFEFSTPPEAANEKSDKYIHTFSQEISKAGGPEKFWNLPAQEGIATPFPKLTRALGGGMRAGEVYVLGANQGSGKTSLALQFAIETMRKNLGVLYFSMEMHQREMFQRMASIEARVDLLEFRDLQRSAAYSIDLPEMQQRLIEASSELASRRLLVSTKNSVTPEYLLEECTQIKSKQRLDLVVIDHMQLMSATGNVRSDYEKFTNISRTVKQVAVELELPVLLVSQTSRNNSTDKRPELECSDLRGSGAIEEDAAAVMLLFPDAEDKKRTLSNGTFARGPVKTWLKLDKNRYGLQGMYLPLRHFKTYTRFEYSVAENQQEARVA